MSSQNIFIHPIASITYHKCRLQQIKNSAAYAGAMADHYERLFNRRCNGRNLCRAAFAWFKWKHFEKEFLRLTVNEMLENQNIKLAK